MMLDEPIEWNDEIDKEAALDYAFTHQRMTKVNQAMVDQYRATEDQFVGLTPADFFAHDEEAGRAVWRRLFDAGSLHIDTDERRFDGSEMTVEGGLHRHSGAGRQDFRKLRDSAGRDRPA